MFMRIASKMYLIFSVISAVSYNSNNSDLSCKDLTELDTEESFH
jgi:hypothetical protein